MDVNHGIRIEGFMMITLAQFKREIDSLGYKFEAGKMTLDTTTVGNIGYCTQSIVEKDTGISFAHYMDARRDDNFKALQELRKQTVMFNNKEVWV